jgi:acetyltransferase
MDSRYPAHLAREHRLSDGRTVTIRPIRREDDVLEREFLTGLSGESRYQRFHKWVRAPSDKLIHLLTDIDHDKQMAWVCAAPAGNREELVGEARYVCNPDGASCEFGVMIADQWRKTGIAGILMQTLLATARERGLISMEGLVLRSNRKMLRFVRGLGFEIHPIPEDIKTVRVVKKL